VPAHGQEPEYKISTSVERVILPVTVRDKNGDLVTGLAQSNFRVYDSGALQQIRIFSSRDLPVTVGLVVDNSASMKGKLTATALAAVHFVRQSKPGDEVFVVTFNEEVAFGLPDGMPFSNDTAHLAAALQSRPPTGKTALYDAIAAALEHLSRGSREKKALIVVSDGGDNASRRGFKDVLEMARRSDALIYTLGVFNVLQKDPDESPAILKKLARETGGECFLPENIQEIAPVCGRIAKELRAQYTIGYAPTEAEPGFHRVQVIASAPGRGKLDARTRGGYYAGRREAQ
jgi:VWFA-related protein